MDPLNVARVLNKSIGNSAECAQLLSKMLRITLGNAHKLTEIVRKEKKE